VTDALFLAIGLVMIGGLLFLTGLVPRDDVRFRSRWDARFDREAREIRRTDATGVLHCRKCGASGSERAGVCAKCGAAL
jgi:ribosomal protein L40E